LTRDVRRREERIGRKEGPSIIKETGLGGEPPSPVGRPVEGPWVVYSIVRTHPSGAEFLRAEPEDRTEDSAVLL